MAWSERPRSTFAGGANCKHFYSFLGLTAAAAVARRTGHGMVRAAMELGHQGDSEAPAGNNFPKRFSSSVSFITQEDGPWHGPSGHGPRGSPRFSRRGEATAHGSKTSAVVSSPRRSSRST